MNEATFYIDASYFIFYRFYALVQWWKVAKKEEPLGEPIENAEFVEKFKRTFIEKLQEIPKKCGINPKKTKIHMYAARDCPRHDIWRREIFPDYKANRNYEGFQGKPFFAMAYDEDLFGQAGVIKTFYHPRLEADDCIAISVKQQRLKNPQHSVYIIASDHDYLQLVSPYTHIINLRFKKLAESKTGSYDAKQNLFIKTVMGDTSDNIPSIFPKCGYVTAKKCYEDQEFYAKKKSQSSESETILARNNHIINFDCIPQQYINEFLQ
jgi:5'-3' exonuclease